MYACSVKKGHRGWACTWDVQDPIQRPSHRPPKALGMGFGTEASPSQCLLTQGHCPFDVGQLAVPASPLALYVALLGGQDSRAGHPQAGRVWGCPQGKLKKMY